MDLLNPLLNCFVTFKLSLVDKVSFGGKRFVSVKLNFVSPSTLEITQFLV